jgi:hypothetical protein
MIAPRIPAVTVLAASVVLAAAMASAAMAQTSVAQGAQPGPQNDLASRTAAVRGVVTSDTGTPVSGVEVRLAGSEWHRLTTTDAAGRFVFRDLPAEVMRVHASKAGFVDAQYGPFALAPEQRETAALTLGRSGVIYGHVFDEVGEPAAGALVEALLAVSVEGLRKRLQSVGGGDLADDTGAFRLYGLPPGTYFVSARPGPAGTANRGAATYYPGTPGVATALPLEVETGSQVAVSLSLGAVPLARVSGVLVNADGTPTFGNVTLLPQVGMAPREPDDRVSVDVEGTRLSSNAGPDGRFTIADVPPGPYELTGTRGRPGETASLPVLVSGQDITGLTVVTRPQAP